MNVESTKKKNRIAYIIEAALEYFVSLLVTGAFLAALLKYMGISDAAVGILTSLSTLGFAAQAAALIITPKGSPKKRVMYMHLANQLMFVFLYMIPFISIPTSVKTVLFAIMLLGGHVISNSIMPIKLNWLMSFVDDNRRGEFTANKEIISLVFGIIFSYIMGGVSDKFTEMGKSEIGFLICGGTLLALTILHFISIIAVKDVRDEAEITAENSRSIRETLKSTFSGGGFKKVMVIDILWHMGTGFSVSYFGTYQIKELGFSLTYVAVLNAIYSVVRVLFSRSFGKFADKYSWKTMMTLSFSIGAIGFLINSFAVPSNGKIVFTVYYIFYAIYLAGSNSGIMNLTFDYVEEKDRVCALGIKSAVGGAAGFIASLCGARVVTAVQGAGNTVLGYTLYAQQILSFITCLTFVIAAVFIKTKVKKVKK